MKTVERVRKISFRLFNVGGRKIQIDVNYIKQALIYVIAFLVIPYLFTLTINLASILFVLLLVGYPLLVLIISFIYSKSNFDIFSGLIPAGIFLITIRLYLNSSAWVYCVTYFFVGIMGNYIRRIVK